MTINIQVELRQMVDPFDYESWKVVVPAGHPSSQHFRWLAFASCLRMALATGDEPSKYVPQIIKTLEGAILDANKNIEGLLEDNSEVVVECSRGPKSFTLGSGEGQDEESMTESSIPGPLNPAVVGDIDHADSGASSLLDNVEWSLHGIQNAMQVKAVLSPHVGLLQALLIWYSCQGDELEDKDFAVLNFGQFVQLFQDALGPEFSESLERVPKDVLKVGRRRGLYQLTILEFIPALFQVASDLPIEAEVQGKEENDLFCKRVSALIEEKLVPLWTTKIKPRLTDIQTSSRKECLEVLKSSRETLEACLKACQPGIASNQQQKFPFTLILPFLKKWRVLDKHRKPPLVAMLVINALFNVNAEPIQLEEAPFDLDFGIRELQEFVLGAAYFCHREAPSPVRISDKAYLQEYLKRLFARACVTKPPYTTYDEKKDYLRSILIKKDAA